jgi:nitrogen regulatory protein PII
MKPAIKRVEVFINQSIAEDLQEKLKKAGVMETCTRWTPVYGRGHAGPRQGTAIWPETNSGYLIFMEEGQLDILRSIIQTLKAAHPAEGLKCFISEGPQEII